MRERQRAQLWDSMNSVVTMGTAKWCPNDLSHSPTIQAHFPAIVQLPLVCTFPLLCPTGKEGVIPARPATLPHRNWYFQGKKRLSLGAAVLDPADEGELSP